MATDDFFCARLDGIVDPHHPLAVLGRRMPWAQIEAPLAPLFARKARMGKSREDADMFGPKLVVALRTAVRIALAPPLRRAPIRPVI